MNPDTSRGCAGSGRSVGAAGGQSQTRGAGVAAPGSAICPERAALAIAAIATSAATATIAMSGLIYLRYTRRPLTTGPARPERECAAADHPCPRRRPPRDRAHRARDRRTGPRSSRPRPRRYPRARRSHRGATARSHPPQRGRRPAARLARHHALPRRPDPHRARPGGPRVGPPLLGRRQDRRARRRRAVHRAHDPPREGGRRGLRQAARHPPRRARRPRPPRAPDPRRLRRQERAYRPHRRRARPARRERRHRRGRARARGGVGMTWQRRRVLATDDWSRAEIEQVLETTGAMVEVLGRPIRRTPALRGRTVILFFPQASTRTPLSFDPAAKALSADVTNITAIGSSVEKGETLLDTVRTLTALGGDVIVMRHAASGAPYFVAQRTAAAGIPARDRGPAHPTQGLPHAFTPPAALGGPAGKRI